MSAYFVIAKEVSVQSAIERLKQNQNIVNPEFTIISDKMFLLICSNPDLQAIFQAVPGVSDDELWFLRTSGFHMNL